MSGLLSKRQQARNEKSLQDLVQSVPGNNACADCEARNPAWASWNLGIFLCMRCAAIHRKLGTHVSKVKSLSMDSWSNEQVDNMRKVGNAASNKVYNPIGQKPPVPIDVDEADSAMERFIRQKYINSAFTKSASNSRHRNTGSSGSEDIPPPLPPKTPGRLNVRSASSIFPLSSKASATSPATNGNGSSYFDNGNRTPTSPLPRAMSYPRPESSGSGSGLRSKVSQVFGSTKDSSSGDGLDGKLARLRDMGFSDDRRNTVVLKAVSWDLERAIEMLVRMGDAGVSNGRLSPHPPTSQRDSSLSAPTRTLTPAASTNSAGLTVPTLSSQRTPSSPSVMSSMNPFDALDFAASPAAPQSSQSTGTIQNKNPYVTTNPFDIAPTQPPQATPLNTAVATSTSTFNLNQAFQNMALSPPQPLFPHHTGSSTLLQHQHQALQATSPSITTASSHTYFSSGMPTSGHQQHVLPHQLQYSNTYEHTSSISHTQQMHQNQYQPAVPFQQSLSVNTTAAANNMPGNNPFTRSPTRLQSPNALAQIPEQAQANYFAALPQSQTYPLLNGNPYGSSPRTLHSPQQTNNPFVTQPPTPLQPPRLHNTASIMALYNTQQFAPSTAQPAMSQSETMTTPNPVPTHAQQSQPQLLVGDQSPFGTSGRMQTQRQSPAGNNPFFDMANNASGMSMQTSHGTQYPARQLSASAGQPHPPPPLAPSSGVAKGTNPADLYAGGRSRDSMMALGLEWTNGRHSPDAFASLSAHH